jgi:RNA polymerase sigma factor (sigma-70 family)
MDDGADFTAFYEHAHPRVLGVLCAVSGDRHTAIDATDEAFVRALERWSRVGKMSSPDGWTYRVALNGLRRAKRRAAKERAASHHLAITSATPTNPELWEAVRALAPRQCQAIALRYVADLPEAEIAEVMGITRGTVASTLADARAQLAQQLGEPSLSEESA